MNNLFFKKGFKGYLISFVSVIVIAIALLVFSLQHISSVKADTPSDINQDYVLTTRDTHININSEGTTNIVRNRIEERSIVTNDSWTVLVYMPGSNLESNYGNASYSLDCMSDIPINSSNVDNLNIIVETGGCKSWSGYALPSKKLSRLKLDYDGKFKCVEFAPLSNMGDPQTLYEFIKWGLTNYPAKNIMLVFWGHGSSSINGLCFDELYENDGLTPYEIEYALAKSKTVLDSPIDIIAFDTCTTGTLEYANALAPYANYMVASADSVSGRGLGYNKPFSNIINTPSITPLEVATSLCKASVANVDYTSSYTFTTYDLNKLDRFLVEFDNLFNKIYKDCLVDINTLSYMDRIIKGTYRYTAKDHIDVGHYLSNISNRYDTSVCNNALNEIISYSTRGKDLRDYGACGLSFYHPSGKYNLGTMNLFRNMITSPNYMKYLELTYRYRDEGDTSNFRDYSWSNSPCFFEDNFNFLNYFNYSSRRDTPRQMYNYLIQNEMYKNDGFLLRWCQNMYNETP